MSTNAGGENDSFICASPPISSPAISLHSRFFYIMGREGMESLGGEELLHYYWMEAMKE
jgi:hypothetical protein